MFTLIESPFFSKRWPDYWSEDERGKFAAWLAQNPEPGDVVPGSGGVRKSAGRTMAMANVEGSESSTITSLAKV